MYPYQITSAEQYTSVYRNSIENPEKFWANIAQYFTWQKAWDKVLDADFEKAEHTSVRSSFSNQGEICLCGSRIFVERSIYEKFKVAFVEETKKLKVGDPLHEESWIGAIPFSTLLYMTNDGTTFKRYELMNYGWKKKN